VKAAQFQALIAEVERERAELQGAQPEAKQQARVRALLPKAGAEYVRQLEQGIDGDAKTIVKARLILRACRRRKVDQRISRLGRCVGRRGRYLFTVRGET
jgi:hypothetical protein